ncbi:MAG: family 16 glycosylhydrolase [Prolixibacteraceae bacterium]|nr:family 16 glycosylhydrolase [Prolixibacteraceae bacterium]
MNTNYIIKLAAMVLLLNFLSVQANSQNSESKSLLPGGDNKWNLVWNDEFDQPDSQLDQKWESQNGPSGHILCSRWRENAEVSNGTLKLINRKENRGGQEWTSGNIWTKEQFQYGYYECRYRYAAAEGTNNSFWLMMKGIQPKEGKFFELDINEGHYPNSVNTNIHNWSDVTEVNGKKTHPSDSKSFYYGVRPDVQLQLEIPVTTRRIRFSSTNGNNFHIPEFRIYNVNPAGYPKALSETADADVSGLINFAKEPTTKITASGNLNDGADYQVQNLADGKITSRWVTQKDGEKWLEFEFSSARQVGCIQFLNGYTDKGNWKGLISNYKVQYEKNGQWVDMGVFDIKNGDFNFARDFHTYGLDWSKEELVFYFDGKEIRREKNQFCYSPAPVWLSLAIIPWAGKITDAIDKTQMEVDYVRIFKKK